MLSRSRLIVKPLFNTRPLSSVLNTDNIEKIKLSIDKSMFQYDYTKHIDKLDVHRQKKLIEHDITLAKNVKKLDTNIQSDLLNKNILNAKYINKLNNKTVKLLENKKTYLELLIDYHFLNYKKNIPELNTIQDDIQNNVEKLKYNDNFEMLYNNVINIKSSSKLNDSNQCINIKIKKDGKNIKDLESYIENEFKDFDEEFKNFNNKFKEIEIYCNGKFVKYNNVNYKLKILQDKFKNNNNSNDIELQLNIAKLIKDLKPSNTNLSIKNEIESQISIIDKNPLDINNMDPHIETLIHANNINKEIKDIIKKYKYEYRKNIIIKTLLSIMSVVVFFCIMIAYYIYCAIEFWCNSICNTMADILINKK